MKKSEIQVGGVYSAKVSTKVVPVRIDRENPRGGWDGTNLVTKKAVRIKSAQRLRGKAATWPGKKTTPAEAQAVHAADQENARLAEERAKSPDGRTDSERAMAETESAGKKPKAKAEKKERKPSGLDAAAQVLGEAGEPLNTKEMVERMLAGGLWQTNGKTPAATIYAAILREIATKGDDARFRKVERGKFELAK